MDAYDSYHKEGYDMAKAANPNGLTDEQIAARPAPYVGMVSFTLNSGELAKKHPGIWGRPTGSMGLYTLKQVWTRSLLPGEPGCPEVPPEFRRDWQVGDAAWVSPQAQHPSARGWFLCDVATSEYAAWDCDMCFLSVSASETVYAGHIDTPALYIPPAAADQGEPL